MKILLLGYYGFDNLGDEAILRTLVYNIPKFLPTAELTVISSHPKKTHDQYKVRTVSRSIPKITKAIRGCDVFMLGGGGLLQDTTSLKSLLFYLYLLYYAKKRGKKVILFAQGIGPIKRFFGKIIAKHILKNIDLITIRDNLSYLELVKLKIKKVGNIFSAADVTPMMFEAEGIPQKNHLHKSSYLQIGIAARQPFKKGKSLAATLAKTADTLIETLGAQITFLPMQPRDVGFIKKIRGKMNHPSRMVQNNLDGFITKTKELDLILGVRLHSLIFASILNVPSVAIAYDQKVEAFAEFMGIPCHNLKSVSAEKLIQDINSVLDNKTSITEKLQSRCEVLKLNALLNFNILKSFFSAYPKVTILGAEIHNLKIFEVIDFIRIAIAGKSSRQIITVNPELIYLAQSDPMILDLINSADLKTADGAGLLWAAKYLKTPVQERITGIDLLERLLKFSNLAGYRIFLLGGDQKVIEKTVKKIQRKYENINLVGYQDGYFTDDQEIVNKIKAAKPDILFVGLGAPKQDFWIAKHKEELGVPVSIGVGGSFDVISGIKKRAPQWIQKIRAEWVYRLIKEPKRAQRQVNLFKFMWQVMKARRAIIKS
ncbi:MAG: polysaccharide pyruvyl transferase CsaB [Candidatus Margulisbacteria bacterium]|nr:polysaccharide pyruvyl transferase CsaB [Candidatus Margulisiibacteriota bacterium]MBU1022541.1 polysaccharide pyruvyl transferase CsaB [Candidatus Margulisiibacteriota bacterium]MBU1728827.1 polysaccharide pyruvyl transferase CsaB [Candidatus Margulisiibacteriota bacterium]MBU1955793.1 polysaccharide pyruvyl transferase CsaB [Candidatus Margulisiibacteriota bacterium]